MPSSLILLAITATVSATDPTTTLWFDKPAASFHQSLPLGNGRLGAMAYDESSRTLQTMPEIDLNRIYSAAVAR